MAMVVKNNMSAVSTLNTLNKNSSALQKSLSKVSSGMKINSAQDDASGYAISERMRVQIRSLDQANQNTQNGSSMMKTAEGAVSSTVEILKSLKEKAINAANDTNKDSDRTTIQKEIDQFIDQIDDNALTTFNGKYLVDGSKSAKGNDTFSKFTNQSLKEDQDGTTALTALKNRNGEDLEIRKTDKITASYVQNGKTYTTTFTVGTNQLQNIFDAMEGIDTTSQTFAAADASRVGTASSSGGATTVPTGAKTGLGVNTLADVSQLTGVTDSDTLATKIANAEITTDTLKAIASAAAADITNSLATATDALVTNLTTNIGDAEIAKADGTTKKISEITNAGTGGNGDSFVVSYSDNTAATTLTGANPDEGAAAGTIVTAANAAAAGDTSSYNTVKTAIENKVNGLKVASTPKGDSSDAAYGSYTVAGTVSDATASKVEDLAAAVIEKAAYDKVAAFATASGLDLTNDDDLAKLQAAADGASTTTTSNSEVAQTDVLVNSDVIGKNAAGDDVKTADGNKGLTLSSAAAGVKNQVSGITISVTDSEGNVKKSANAALDDFKATIYAKNASDPNELTFQVGAAANQAITVSLEDMRSEALGLKGADNSKVSVATQDKANAAVAVFDNAIQKALDQQTTIGSIEARLEYTSQNLTTSSENVQAAESTIRDADMAKEMTNYTKNNVLLQAAQSMLAQANQSSSAVLSLLQ